jgi:hypothetical protein
VVEVRKKLISVTGLFITGGICCWESWAFGVSIVFPDLRKQFFGMVKSLKFHETNLYAILKGASEVHSSADSTHGNFVVFLPAAHQACS